MAVWAIDTGALVAGFLLALTSLHLAAAVYPHGGDGGAAAPAAAASREVSPSAGGSLPVQNEKCSNPGALTPRATTTRT